MEIAVCIPAYNEEKDIGTVVRDFKAVLPKSAVYVYDNNSTDNTTEIARSAGAAVRHESRQGKGWVVRRMLADIDADIYIIVDGDNTYDPKIAPILVKKLVNDNLDMVVGSRLGNEGAFRKGHYTGNVLFSKFVSILFSNRVKDVLSGYRVLSRRFVKSFPASSKGFEIESELTIHCLELGLPLEEVGTDFKNRSPESGSKLNTFRDGFRVLSKIVLLLKATRPFLFFGSWALVFLAFGSLLVLPVFAEYFKTGLVPRFPTLIVATGMYVLSLISFVCGIILNSVANGRLELKRLFYLQNYSTGKERS